MSKNFVQSALLRSIALGGYRLYAQSQFWRTGPKVFVNSIPKAGTHLLTSILEEIPGLMLSRLHVDCDDVSVGSDRHTPLVSFELNAEKLAAKLGTVRDGQVATGHLPWREDILRTLLSMGFQVFFVRRNPDDLLRSRLYYIEHLRRHHLHQRLVTEFPDDGSRMEALRNGFPASQAGPGTENYSAILSQYEGWMASKDVTQFSFEELVGSRGGGVEADRQESLSRALAAVGADNSQAGVENLNMRAINKRTPTLRAGKIGKY